ncbi:MAG: serine/threonine-protein kinase [Planctomycetaceae bacterium]
MAARLSFPNIVPVIDFGESGGRCFFAMRLIEGVGLDWVIQRLRDNSEPLVSSEVGEHFRIQGIPLQGDDPEADDDDSLACEFNSIRSQEGAAEKPAEKWQLRRDSWRQFARIGIQAAKALQHAHKAGIWHRDIKPGNLLLDEAGVIWITDFGLAKSERNLSLTASNDVVGTLRYLAPERFDGKLDARSDIYGLGLTLLELALQQHAFEESARTTLIRSIMDGRITPPRQINPQLPEPLERILLKATATKPSARYATAQALIHDLRAFAKGEQVSLPVPAQRSPRRLVIPWKPLTIVLAGICLLQGALLWHAWKKDKGSVLPGEQAAPFQASLRERLQALDGLYEQVLRRDLAHDIRNRTTVEPLPAYSIQHAALEHLLILYSRASDEAEAAQWTADREEFQVRVDLLSRLKGR